MKKVILNNKVVLLYDSIDELPIKNFQKYNKYLLIDAGIGSTVDDVDRHISRIARYINSDKKLAMQELQNMRQNLYMINNGISPKYLAFAALIHSIDGKRVEDLSDDNLKSILEDLNTEKHSILANLVGMAKKKIQEELELYFPKEFMSAKEKEVYDKIKQRTLLVLSHIINGNDNTKDIQSIDDYFLSLHKPNSFSGSESVEIAYDKQFETMCMLISQKSNMCAADMTVLQFYNALTNIQLQIEAEQKAYKKHKR